MSQSSNGTLRRLIDATRSRLWPLPVLAIVLAVAAGILIPHLDRSVDEHLPGWLDTFVFSGDAGAARSVLSTIANSLITVTSLTFSLTVVTLQLASSQFSPRLLRTFTRDVFVQATLGIFLATFTFSLTVLRSVRSTPDSGNGAAHVPDLAVTIAFLLALASVVSLILFLAHLTTQIRVETMLRTVHHDARDTLKDTLSPRSSSSSDATPAPSTVIATIWAQDSGFIVNLDRAALVEIAREADVTIVTSRQIGDFVVAATPVGFIAVGEDSDVDRAESKEVAERAASKIHVGVERTASQDIAYGLRQLTDVAVKALSPGINDPTTAIHALGHSSALLTELMTRELGSEALCDDDGVTRLIVDTPSFSELLDLAVAQPRKYGQADSRVMLRLSQLLCDIAWHAEIDHRPAILSQLGRLRTTISRQDFDVQEKGALNALGRTVESIIRGSQDGLLAG